MSNIKIALAGNPNSGKTTLFNLLTGSNQYVGNWPGVTVEKKEGKLKELKDVIIQDLPGIYSLSPYSLEEIISRDYLINDKPDAILNVVDATNIERNLYLTTQLIELGVPVVIALNMIDIVRKNGDIISVDRLAKELGCPVIETSALRGEGAMEAARRALALGNKSEDVKFQPCVFTGSVEHAIAHIEESIEKKVQKRYLRWYAIKVFEGDNKILEELNLEEEVIKHLNEHIKECEKEMDDDAESIIIGQRYNYINSIMQKALKKSSKTADGTISDKIDKVVTNRILALPIFAFIMFLVYKVSIGTVGNLVTTYMNDTLAANVIEWLHGIMDEAVNPIVSGLFIDGIVSGVGAVLGFVPQMLILFIFLAILEQCGYMARVAFIMDRMFRRFGLSGKSFIPLLVSTGCAVPGIMSSRTIENQRDRHMTIMTTGFIPCSAKLPIVGLIAAAIFGGNALIGTSAYFVGLTAVIVSGIILKKTKAFTGELAEFVMELPSYHLPTFSGVFRSMWERGWSFIKRAGTVIVLASVFIWFMSYFGITENGFEHVEDMDKSMLAFLGNGVAWIFKPLGFGNWESVVATIMGLVAKEEVVGVFGTLSSVGADAAMELVEAGGAEAVAGLSQIGIQFFSGSQIAGYSFLLFNLLCAPCFAAIGAIRREMNNAKWTFAAIGYMTGFAWIVSFMFNHFAQFIKYGAFGIQTAIAFVALAVMLYLLFRKNPYKKEVKA